MSERREPGTQASRERGPSSPGVEQSAQPPRAGDESIEIRIDRDTCMGSGNCSFWAPGIFDLDEDGIAMVCGDPTGHEDRVELAATHCPTSSITVTRASG